MNKPLKTLLFSCAVIALFASYCSAQTCQSYAFANNALYSSCNDLSVLNAHLHWNYHPSNGTVDIAFRHTGATTSNWIVWAINPSGLQMVGSQALVAFQNSTGHMRAYTSSVTSYQTNLPEGSLSFAVPSITAMFANNEMTIFATLQLPSNTTTVNQVWQVGPLNGDTPGIHPTSGANMISVSTVNFLSGQTTGTTSPSNSRTRRRNVHGVLNAVSWGTLMPMGAMIARYLKVFKSADPAWFYLHVACQFSAYAVGVAGWATGLKLGSDSPGVTHDTHRNIGIALFSLGTLQLFALLLRPKKDHKYRLYWNIYHHCIGYTVIILSIVNIYEGFDILDPEKKWKWIYSGILIALGTIAVILEAITWLIVIKRKKTGSEKPVAGSNGANGANGYGARTQPAV